MGAYLSTYLKEKGKNLATKEGIGELTRIVEEIKNEHAKELELLKSHHQLRMAAIDKRLQAHQEAFALWRRLYRGVHSDGIAELVKECEKWWNDNCLYLEPEAREAFSDAYWAASIHKQGLTGGLGGQDDAMIADITRNWEKIEKAGSVIVRAVQLPGLSADEQARMKESASENGRPGPTAAPSENG